MIFRADSSKKILDYIKSLNCVYVEIDKFIKTRTNEQNRLYWKCVSIIAEEQGLKKDDLHEILKRDFLGLIEVEFKGRKYAITKSTAKLTTEDFSILLEKVYILGEQLNCKLPYTIYEET